MTSIATFQCGRAAARAVFLSLAALAASATVASADPPVASPWMYDRTATTPMTQGQFYLGFTATAGVQQLPRFNGTQSFHDFGVAGLPPLGTSPSFSPDLLGAQPGGEIGYVFRDGTFPAWMGSRVRAALYGSIAIAEATDSQSFRPAGVTPVITYNGVSGRLQAFTALPAGSSFAETLKVEREAFQLGLKLESDIALGPNLSLTPALAVFGGRIHDTYDHASVIKNLTPGVDAVPTSIHERLRTSELGGHFGARLTWQFQPGWALHLGGTAGAVWMRSRLTAADCLNFVTIVPGTPCSPGGGSFSGSNASDSRSTVGFRGTASLGIAVDARIAVISLGGFARYDSRIPGIQNRQQTTAFSAVALAPARIRFDDGFAYGGFLTIRVALPH